MTRKELFRKQKNYTRYIVSNVINRFGDSIDAIAMVWITYAITQNASISAIVFAVNYLPTVILSPFVGAYVEKLNRKAVMVSVDLLRCLIVLFYAFSYYNKFLDGTMIIILTLLISTIECFGSSASMGIIPTILDEEYYEIGISTNQSLSNVTELVGAGLAGVVISVFTPLGALLIDAITFLTSALLKATIKPKEDVSQSKNKSESYLTLLKEGFKYLSKSKLMIYLCVMATLMNGFLIPYNAFVAAYVSDFYGDFPGILSVFSVSISLGMIIGALILPALKGKFSVIVYAVLASIIAGGLYLYLALIVAFDLSIIMFAIISIIVFVIFGISVAFASTSLNVTLISSIDHNYLSRMSSVLSAFVSASIPIGSFIMSALIKHIDMLTIFKSFSVIAVLVAFGLYITNPLKSETKKED